MSSRVKPQAVPSIRPTDGGPAGPPVSVSMRPTTDITTGTWRTLRPEYVTRPSPCNLDCPAGTDVRAFLALAAEGDIAAAWHTIRRHNPFPGICGRVCYHPCERACNRAALDEPISVHAVERAVASEARRLRIDPEAIEATIQGPRVGIVGAGPAGLSCAYHLARRGYPVTIFDEHALPGGMLRYGIPAYRLPRRTLDREISLLERMGMTFATGVRIGSVPGAPDLTAYGALFVAIGAQRARSLTIPGDTLAGVRTGIDLLREVNSAVGKPMLGRAVVIGGGNTAIDAARCALRLGAEVTIVYRRALDEMPAHEDEVQQARDEGIQFVAHAAPVQCVARDGRVAAVELQRMRAGEPDASGRRRPEPVPGETFTLEADHVLMAIGEEAEVDALHGIAASLDGHFRADRWGRTDRPAVFAGGDAATGAGTIVDAIGSGRRAADAIIAHLQGRDLVEEGVAERVTARDLNLFYFDRGTRAVAPRRRTAHTFEEVVSGLRWPQARDEARRCLTCGSCTACDNCYVFCPDVAISRQRDTGPYAIDLNHCKGCGICAAECPRGALVLVPEPAQ